MPLGTEALAKGMLPPRHVTQCTPGGLGAQAYSARRFAIAYACDSGVVTFVTHRNSFRVWLASICPAAAVGVFCWGVVHACCRLPMGGGSFVFVDALDCGRVGVVWGSVLLLSLRAWPLDTCTNCGECELIASPERIAYPGVCQLAEMPCHNLALA